MRLPAQAIAAGGTAAFLPALWVRNAPSRASDSSGRHGRFFTCALGRECAFPRKGLQRNSAGFSRRIGAESPVFAAASGGGAERRCAAAVRRLSQADAKMRPNSEILSCSLPLSAVYPRSYRSIPKLQSLFSRYIPILYSNECRHSIRFLGFHCSANAAHLIGA